MTSPRPGHPGPAGPSARPGRTLRARLALLYALLFLVTGIVLLAIADLPTLTFGQVAHVASPGKRLAPIGAVRATSNLSEVLRYSSAALAVLVVLSVPLGWLMANRALRPLRAITAAARGLSAPNLGERVSPGADSYAEFRELGETLDGLFARLEAAFESQRHFVANASHELRTPLAAERTVIQVALADPDASAESLRAACRQLLALGEQQERLIDALLTLASGQRGLREREPFDLAEITARVAGARAGDAVIAGVRVDADLAPAVAAGDPRLAESLVANLIENAIRHNVPGGRVEVTTATVGGDVARLSIWNTGPVIPSGDVARLFQPFQQLDRERIGHGGGQGLGLAIVAAIAGAHGATLAARARPEGGLDLTVTFRRWP